MGTDHIALLTRQALLSTGAGAAVLGLIRPSAGSGKPKLSDHRRPGAGAADRPATASDGILAARCFDASNSG